MHELVIKADFVVDRERVLENTCVRIEDGRIAEVGGEYKPDVHVRILCPGFANFHSHAPMLGLEPVNKPMRKWLQAMLIQEMKRVNKKFVREWAKKAFLELLRNGATLTVEMYYHPTEMVKAAKEAGIRIATGPVLGFQGFGILNEVEEEGGLPVAFLHSVYLRFEPEKAKKALEKGYHLQIHVSETMEEIFECKEKKNAFPVELLNDLDLVTERTSLVHLGWIRKREVAMINERGAWAVHCPFSNAKLCTHGFFWWKELKNVLLGTDGPMSGPLNPLENARFGLLLQWNHRWEPVPKPERALEALTRGYEALGLKGGLIKEGFLADLVGIRVPGVPKRSNVIDWLIFHGEVECTIVGGKIIAEKFQSC